jgi:endonuclease VIII
MPEGDTIYRTAQTLSRALARKMILAATSTLPALDASSLIGHIVSRAESHGKQLRIHFDDGRVLLSHMRMRGSWHIYQPGEPWQRPVSGARLVLTNDTYVAVCFYAPVIELLSPRAAGRNDTLGALGPDLLAPVFDLVAAHTRLRARGELPIGVALMTQSIVAGIGNVYKSEILFLCGVDPFVPVSALTDPVLEELLEKARALMRRNVGGHLRITREDGSGEPLWVYGRSGKSCARCGAKVRMLRQGDTGRSTYFCASCQRVSSGSGAR